MCNPCLRWVLMHSESERPLQRSNDVGAIVSLAHVKGGASNGDDTSKRRNT